MKATNDEIVVIVDKEDNKIGIAARSAMRAKRMIHRAAYVLVFNSRGELYLQKRTMTKDVYPGYYDVAAGGVVLAGESYEESAERELFEELGISSSLVRLFDNYYEDDDNRVWGRIFSCVHEGPFTLQEEEVESGTFLAPREVLAMSGEEPVTPDGIIVLKRYLSEYQ